MFDDTVVFLPQDGNLTSTGVLKAPDATPSIGIEGLFLPTAAVDDVRGLGAFMHMTPAMGKWRVAIVDSADEMNRNSANAVLKILEEPPKRAMFLVLSHAPGKLLPTIRSRCRELRLTALPARAATWGMGRTLRWAFRQN